MSTAQAIQKRIEQVPLGEPFTSALLLELGPRAAVDQALSRLVRSGTVSRVARGVFVRPRSNRYTGAVPPAPERIAETLARSTGTVVQPHGAQAASRLGFTTQIPVRPVFWTNGPSRHLKAGNLTIELRHTDPRKLALAGRPAGEALAALWYLGKEGVTPEVIATIRHKLPHKEFEALQRTRNRMPAWMSDAFYRYERSLPND